VTQTAPRRRLSSDDRRSEISAAARELFAVNGYHATTTRQLAKAAGVSDALLYRHFESKQDLLAHVIDEAISTFGSLPPLKRMADLTTAQLLTRLGQGFLERVGSNIDLIKILIEGGADARDERFVRFIDGAAQGLGDELVRRKVAATAEAGYLSARSFFGSLISFVLLQRVLGMDAVRAVDAGAYVKQLVAAYSVAA
jgi:AcrR family transcriptional regulator